MTGKPRKLTAVLPALASILLIAVGVSLVAVLPVLGSVLLIALGISLVAFHRPLARWQRDQWQDWQPWPIRLLPTSPLLAYVVPLVAVGIGFVVVGVLSLAGVIHWKE